MQSQRFHGKQDFFSRHTMDAGVASSSIAKAVSGVSTRIQ
jgi:hypothetical protein